MITTEDLAASRQATRRIEAALQDQILEILGATPRDPSTWPVGDLQFDDYDPSLELLGADPGWTPTPEQWARLWALGFSCAWIVALDDTETFHDAQGVHLEPRPSLVSRHPYDRLRLARRQEERLTDLQSEVTHLQGEVHEGTARLEASARRYAALEALRPEFMRRLAQRGRGQWPGPMVYTTELRALLGERE